MNRLSHKLENRISWNPGGTFLSIWF